MNQGPDIFKEVANQKVSPDYAVSSAPFGVFFLIAIAAGVVVAITTNNLLLGGIILVGLVVVGVIVTMLLARRQKRKQEPLLSEREKVPAEAPVRCAEIFDFDLILIPGVLFLLIAHMFSACFSR